MLIVSSDSTELVDAEVSSISDILGVANLINAYIIPGFSLYL